MNLTIEIVENYLQYKQYPEYLIMDYADWIFEEHNREKPELRQMIFGGLYYFWSSNGR